MVEFAYPWLPSKCDSCGKWGHLEKVCSMNKKQKDEKNEAPILEIPVRDESLENMESGETSKKMEERVNTKGNEGEDTEKWEKVSPEKVGRTPLKELQFGQSKIITPLRFTALSIPEEENEVENEKQVEEQEEISEVTEEEAKVEEVKGSKRNGEEGRSRVIVIEGSRHILPRNSKTKQKVLSSASNHTKDELGIMIRGSQKNH